jgi:PTH1 family peptidyl-tRNA hydrolase
VGLFQKQQIRKELVLPYTLATSEAKRLVVVGLGNPGKKYDGTRHNIGFAVIDEVAKNGNFPDFSVNKDFKAELSEQNIGTTKIILVKPTTYMNESGTSVQKIAQFYKIPLENIVVVHDELSIAFGQIRMRIGGQSAGHNGIKSVIQHCGQEFGRVRVGIKNEFTPKDDTSDFVLGTFTKDEKQHLPALINEASLVVSEYMYSGTLPHDTRSIILI